jgi:hypothetical protein
VEKDPRFEEYSGLARPIAAPVPIVLETGTDRLAALNMEDALAAFRQDRAPGSRGPRPPERHGQLTEDEARRLLERGDLSLSAYLARCSSAAGTRRLRGSAGPLEQYPDDPQARYMLARNLAANPETRGEALEQIAALNALSSDNSLGRYMEAQVRLESGDVDGAPRLAGARMTMQSATPSAWPTRKTGAPPSPPRASRRTCPVSWPTPRRGAASTRTLTTLGDDLMARAPPMRRRRTMKPPRPLHGVHSLGEQVVEGAEFSNEQLAGRTCRCPPSTRWCGVTEVLATPGGMQMLEAAYGALAESLTSFQELVSMMDEDFAEASPETAVAAASQALAEGDPGLMIPARRQ